MKEKNMYGKMVLGVARTTFLIDNGKVTKVFTGVKAEGHAEQILATL
jgi:peroxiredoxin Q/BCP